MELRPGDVIGIPYRGVRHEGIVSVAGTEDTARVIHSSKRRGRVVEESARVFRAGRMPELVARSPVPEVSIGYARACEGRPWTWLDNCQSFTREVSGVNIPSRDTNRNAWVAVGAIAATAWLSARRRARSFVR